MKLGISSLARWVFVASFLLSWVGLSGASAARPPGTVFAEVVSLPSAELKTVPTAPISPSPHPILSDIRIRRAIAHCTDKDALVAAAFPHLTPFERQDLIMDTFVHHTSWAYSTPAMTYPYSTTLGTALLDDAGWTIPTSGDIRMKGGQELALTLTTSNSNLRITITSVFENQMRDCGIRLIRNHQSSTWWFSNTTGLAVRDFELGEFAWISDANEPGGKDFYACDQIPMPANGWSGRNYMGWCNPAASDAIIQASDTSLPTTTRQAHYATFIDLFAEDMPSLPLFAFEGNYGTWEHIDFNLETYSQQVNANYNDGGTLNFTSFHGYDGSLFVPAGVVTPTAAMMYSPLESALGGTPDGMTSVVSFRLTALENGVPLTEFTFTQPVTLTHDYADSLNTYEDTLGFYYWDGSDWMPAAETCPAGQRFVDLDTEGNTLVTRICHFSEFSMMGEKKYNIYHPLIVRGE